MKVLIACEYSGIVRDAFSRSGHDATSCDLLPTEIEGSHYQGDVFDIINDGWDLMIAHPPCTYLSWAGNGYFDESKYGEKARERKYLREEALQFFLKLWSAKIPKICIENPRGYPMKFLRQTQMFHPYYYGDCDKKLTCLWLKNLPPLLHSKEDTLFYQKTHSDEPQPIYVDKISGKKRYRTDAISGSSKDGKKERARFYPGVAQAMAQQWGGIKSAELDNISTSGS